MPPHGMKKLDPQSLVNDFGSRSTLARQYCPTGEAASPEVMRAALERYFAAVVRSVAQRVLGDAARALGDGLDMDDVESRQRLDTSATTGGLREQLDVQLADYDTGVSPGEPPPAMDWFGPLYQDLFPRALRHALGEYYTPDWLAEHVLDAVGYGEMLAGALAKDATSTPLPRLLDPTCGSGVFLLAAIRRIRAAAAGRTPPGEWGRCILDSIVGFDVNRLAVLTARANCLLSVRDLLSAGLPCPALPFGGPPCPAPRVRLRDVILDRSEPGETFDVIVGNPPWIAWDNLPDDYRERTKPLWRDYGLFSLTGTQARHGGGKKDLSMLVLYAAADRYLCDGGRLGFVITQTLFQTKGAGDGFRRFRLGEDGPALRVLRVDDMAQFQPFAGAANWTATIALEKGRETVYPVRYVKWLRLASPDREIVQKRSTTALGCESSITALGCEELKVAGSPAAEGGYATAEGFAAGGGYATCAVECLARPIDAARPRSPWILLPAAMNRDFSEMTGPSDYTAHLGANSGGANGVYWVEIVSAKHGKDARGTQDERRDGDSQADERYFRGAKGDYVARGDYHAKGGSRVLIRNLAGVGKRAVEQVEAPIEAELLFPLVRWGDLGRWRAVPRCHLLLAQDTQTRSGIDAETMQRSWPAALAYLARFRPLLEERAAYRRYQSAGPFWSMYNIGPYTLAPTKVVWRRMDRRINAAVVEPVEHPLLGVRPVVVQETCVQVAADSADEAHYLASVLNSAVVNFLVAAHSVGGGKGFGTPSMLDYLNIRRFDPGDSRHRALAELSREAHRLARDDWAATSRRGDASVRESRLRGIRRSTTCSPKSDQLQPEIDARVGELRGLSDQEVLDIEEALDWQSPSI
ncbi:MAG TPA: hypothetical protein DD670_20935 [Planctomycetaceae bacterium]|nr:hypothetical protein [Planctomycetaceae bacterium]